MSFTPSQQSSSYSMRKDFSFNVSQNTSSSLFLKYPKKLKSTVNELEIKPEIQDLIKNKKVKPSIVASSHILPFSMGWDIDQNAILLPTHELKNSEYYKNLIMYRIILALCRSHRHYNYFSSQMQAKNGGLSLEEYTLKQAELDYQTKKQCSDLIELFIDHPWCVPSLQDYHKFLIVRNYSSIIQANYDLLYQKKITKKSSLKRRRGVTLSQIF